MLSQLRRVGYANIMATVAVFAAVSGGAFAAVAARSGARAPAPAAAMT